MFLELRESFSSLAQWSAWSSALSVLNDAKYIGEAAGSIGASGFIDPLFGVVLPDEIVINGSNYRESITARGMNCRYRALLSLLLDHILSNGWSSAVYLGEDMTPFADLLGQRFAHVIQSAFLPNPVLRMRYPQVRHEDPLALSLPDRSFDVYLAPDIMGYTPSMERFLREAQRILRRTGVLLATFPFRHGEPDTLVLSEATPEGAVVHRMQPVFDVNPLSGTRTRLAYFVPGWDILDVAREAGFRSAEIVVQSSRTHAILGEEIAAVFVLKATV